MHLVSSSFRKTFFSFAEGSLSGIHDQLIPHVHFHGFRVLAFSEPRNDALRGIQYALS